jgi:hypothetical protein
MSQAAAMRTRWKGIREEPAIGSSAAVGDVVIGPVSSAVHHDEYTDSDRERNAYHEQGGPQHPGHEIMAHDFFRRLIGSP